MRTSTTQFPSIAYVLAKHEARSRKNLDNEEAFVRSLDMTVIGLPSLFE